MTDYETELISIVAHDLKAPITAVRGFIQLTQATGPLTDEQIHFLERAMGGLDRMESIIANLLDLTRLESAGFALDLKRVNVVELVDDVIQMLDELANQKHINIHYKPDRTVIVPADADLLRHVIMNLLSNAIKYNQENGDVWVRVVDQHNVVRVDVRDTGIGIPENEQALVFEKFFRSRTISKEARRQGTGLGLSICKTIIELHKGSIWLESEVMKGSKFSFTLPQEAMVEKNLETASEVLDAIDDSSQESQDMLDSESNFDAP